jgi:hypothetical protein
MELCQLPTAPLVLKFGIHQGQAGRKRVRGIKEGNIFIHMLLQEHTPGSSATSCYHYHKKNGKQANVTLHAWWMSCQQ